MTTSSDVRHDPKSHLEHQLNRPTVAAGTFVNVCARRLMTSPGHCSSPRSGWKRLLRRRSAPNAGRTSRVSITARSDKELAGRHITGPEEVAMTADHANC